MFVMCPTVGAGAPDDVKCSIDMSGLFAATRSIYCNLLRKVTPIIYKLTVPVTLTSRIFAFIYWLAGKVVKRLFEDSQGTLPPLFIHRKQCTLKMRDPCTMDSLQKLSIDRGRRTYSWCTLLISFNTNEKCPTVSFWILVDPSSRTEFSSLLSFADVLRCVCMQSMV